MQLDMHVGACINRTDKLAAECRVAVVNNRYRHFAYHLIGINKGIYQRVGQRDKQEENKYALVFENGFQFLLERKGLRGIDIMQHGRAYSFQEEERQEHEQQQGGNGMPGINDRITV